MRPAPACLAVLAVVAVAAGCGGGQPPGSAGTGSGAPAGSSDGSAADEPGTGRRAQTEREPTPRPPAPRCPASAASAASADSGPADSASADSALADSTPGDSAAPDSPAALGDCAAAAGRVVAIESVDPDGDGDLHVVLAGGGITLPGVTVLDVSAALRPRRDPRVGSWAAGAGPVYRGSYGQRQIEVTEVVFAPR